MAQENFGSDFSAYFRENDLVMIDDDPDSAYLLIRFELELSVWKAQAAGTGNIRHVSSDKLMRLPQEDFRTLHKKLTSDKTDVNAQKIYEAVILAETYTVEQQEIAEGRELVLRELEAGIIKTAAEAAAKMGLKRTAFEEVKRRYGRDPRWQSLVPKAPGRVAGAHEQDQILVDLYMQAFETEYRNYGATVSAVYGQFEDLCSAAEKVPFSRSTAYRLFKSIDPRIRETKKEGQDYTNKKNGAFPSSFELPGPFSRVQIDSTTADVVIVDTRTKQPLGRPYLTVVEDEYTGGILACYVSFSAPSRAVIASALYQSFTSKKAMLKELGINEGAWLFTGPGACYLVDRGSEHDNKHFRATCRKYGIRFAYRERPQQGGVVESGIRLINLYFIQRLDGSTGSAPRRATDFNPHGKAIYDLTTFNKLVQLEVIRLNDMVRQRDGLSPNQRLLEWYENNRSGIKAPPIMKDPIGFMINMLPGGRVNVLREGIKYKGVLYDHGPVRHLVGRAKVSVRRNPLDLHSLYILHDGIWHCVRALKPSRVPKTETELNAIKRSRKPAGTVGADGVSARVMITEIIAGSKKEAKAVARAKASLLHAERGGLIPVHKPVPAVEVVETNRYANVRAFKGDEDK